MEQLKDIYEKANLFYLGKDVNKDFELTDVLTLLKNKNFTTHAAIIGMTGSGKTGLGIDILEEAAIDNIPAIVIDPKGDMGDMLLTDAQFKPENFLPWVEDEAKAKGVEPFEYASKIATMWKQGIESFGQDSSRVAKFAAVDKTIYTPGSSAGVPINIVSSLELPSRAILEDSDSFASYLSATVSSLLALVNIEANPLESKEYILLAQIIKNAWQNGNSLTIEALVGAILQPSFKKIGVLPLESFYPQSERFALANRFNSVIASPSFLAWLSGESLDIQKLLYDKNGKAKVAIFSIAHLDESQRMFFVTLLLNKIVAWMRLQSGSSVLKSLLYMDEIYGFFPPVKNPPSKEPMLTLLKQARAYGLGVILSTQNPGDIDYKGLSNIGTWFIGRLQTTQDINKVIEGLSGKLDSTFSKDEIRETLSNLKKRTFFLKSAHLEDIRLFSTRWVLSYLKGPLKKDEIAKLMANKKASLNTQMQSALATPKEQESEFVDTLVLDGINERFEVDISGKHRYFGTVAASVSLHFSDARRGLEFEREKEIFIDIENLQDCSWDNKEELEEPLESFPTRKPKEAKFKPLPDFILEDKGLKRCKRELINELYRDEKLELYRSKKLRLESKVNESYEEFVVRIQDILKEKKEEALQELKSRYEKKFERLEAQLNRAKAQVEKEKADQTNSFISAGISILSAFFGRSSASKIGTAVSKSSRVLKERGDLSRAEQKVEDILEKIEELEMELEEKIEEIDEKYSLENYPIDTIFIKPKKSLIEVKEIALLWRVVL